MSISIKAPTDRSILTVICHNRVSDGDDFREDGYVYSSTGERLRKWFVPLPNTKAVIWEPKLKNIAYLESRRWFFLNYARKKCKKAKLLLMPETKKTPKFRGIQIRRNGKKIMVGFDFGNNGTNCGNLISEDEYNEYVFDQELTDKWTYYKALEKHWYKGRILYSAAFKEAMDYYAMNNKFKKNIYDGKLHFVINGRDYWFGFNDGEYSDGFLDRISYPEDTYHKHIEL